MGVYDLTPFMVPCGRHKEMIEFYFKSRTEAQFDTVRKIVQRENFVHGCTMGNPFAEEIGTYRGEFFFLYWSKNGELVSCLISPLGVIKKEARSKDGLITHKVLDRSSL